MNTISKIYAGTAMLCAILLSGCGNSYSDPMDFLKGPGHEALYNRFKEEMEQCGFEGFNFKDAKVELERYGGERVTAAMSMRCREKDYYETVPAKGFEDMSSVRFEIYERFGGELGEKMIRIRNVIYNLSNGEIKPICKGRKLTSKEMEERFTADFRISIPRGKDGEGVYRVQGKDNDILFGSTYREWRPSFMVKGLTTGANVKKFKIPDAESKEAARAVMRLNNICKNIKREVASYDALMKKWKVEQDKTRFQKEVSEKVDLISRLLEEFFKIPD